MALVLLGEGCAARLPPAPPLPSHEAGLAARRPPLMPFRAALTGKVRAAGEKGRFDAGLGALPPDFRLDIFPPLGGGTVVSVGVAGGRLRAVWPRRNECLEAAASADLLGRLLGVDVTPGELLPLLTGHLYRDGVARVESLRYPPLAVAAGEGPAPTARDRLLVAAVDGETGARYSGELEAARDGLALRGRRQGTDGAEVAVEYPRWVPGAADRPAHPGEVRLRVPGRNLSLDLKVKDWAGGGPPPEALLPGPPPGCIWLDPEALAAGEGSLWPAAGDAP